MLFYHVFWFIVHNGHQSALASCRKLVSHNLFISGPSLPSMDVDIVVGNFTDSIVSFFNLVIGRIEPRLRVHAHGTVNWNLTFGLVQCQRQQSLSISNKLG